MHYQTGDVAVIPLPGGVKGNAKLGSLGRFCYEMAGARARRDPTDFAFDVSYMRKHVASRAGLTDAWKHSQDLIDRAASLQDRAEAGLDDAAFGLYGIIRREDASALLAGIGLPPGWYELLSGSEQLPDAIDEIEIVADLVLEHGHSTIREATTEQRASIKRRLRVLYEAGGTRAADTEANSSSSTDSDGEEEADVDKTIPIPPETFLEELSQRMQIHPASVYWLLRELREKDEVICVAELQRFVEDYVSVLVLESLGHRWPRSIELGKLQPLWADRGGMIPITQDTEDAALARAREGTARGGLRF